MSQPASVEPDAPEVSGSSWALDEHPSPADIDWGRIEELFNDRTLVRAVDISEMCGMAQVNSATHWQRAAQNYLVRGHRQWPPSLSIMRQKVDGDGAAGNDLPDWYPPHSSLLPPPDVPGKHGQNRWYKGTIYKWGMRTRRLDFNGDPIRRTAGPAKGRGPAGGRRLRKTQ